jgi:hypothetical protein
MFVPQKDNDVQGGAFYAEFARDDASDVYQLLFTPDGFDNAGKFVPGQLLRRRVSDNFPKKQWRMFTFPSTRLFVEGSYGDTSLAISLTPKELIERNQSALNFLKRVVDSGFDLRKSFFVEVSKDDLTTIQSGKTPTKVIYRVGQVRKALGLPSLPTSK